MQYIVKCGTDLLSIDTEEFIASLPSWNHEGPINAQLLSQHLEAVASAFRDYINDTYRDQLIGMIRDVYPEGFDRLGQFDLYETWRGFVNETQDGIAVSCANETITLEIIADDGTTPSCVISLADILTDEFNELSCDGEFDTTLSSYIEEE